KAPHSEFVVNYSLLYNNFDHKSKLKPKLTFKWCYPDYSIAQHLTKGMRVRIAQQRHEWNRASRYYRCESRWAPRRDHEGTSSSYVPGTRQTDCYPHHGPDARG